MNNQSGEGAPISLVNSAQKGFNDLESAVNENILTKATQTAKANALKLLKQEAQDFAATLD